MKKASQGHELSLSHLTQALHPSAHPDISPPGFPTFTEQKTLLHADNSNFFLFFFFLLIFTLAR